MGSGPPNSHFGWLRTGNADEVNSGNAGEANCNGWSTTDGSGTVAKLSAYWTDDVMQHASPWVALNGIFWDTHKLAIFLHGSAATSDDNLS